MPTPNTKAITKTQAAADDLNFGHRWLMKKAILSGQPITEEAWNTLMYEYGNRFARVFSKCFNEYAEQVYALLVTAMPGDGNRDNLFWIWWQNKWMADDWQYITDKVYNMPISYQEYKSNLLHCDYFEQELLNMITINKHYIKV